MEPPPKDLFPHVTCPHVRAGQAGQVAAPLLWGGFPLCQAGSRREELLQGVQDLSELTVTSPWLPCQQLGTAPGHRAEAVCPKPLKPGLSRPPRGPRQGLPQAPCEEARAVSRL